MCDSGRPIKDVNSAQTRRSRRFSGRRLALAPPSQPIDVEGCSAIQYDSDTRSGTMRFSVQKSVYATLSVVLVICGGAASVAAAPAENSYTVSMRRLTEQ